MKKVDILIGPESTISQAMKKLNKTAKKCLIVVDKKNNFLGTLTDGDMRRSILNGSDFNEKIENAYNKNSINIYEKKLSNEDILKIMTENKVEMIPILKKNNKFFDYVTLNDLMDGKIKKDIKSVNTPVVIMAGGKGTRLKPFTNILPKPLIPIHEKPVILHIINRFIEQGYNHFYLTVNYKSKILKAYFDELEPDFNIDFIDEIKPLGTVGSLKFLKNKIKSEFVVINCDTIINSDFSDIIDYHKSKNQDLTLVASLKKYKIPFGTCELGSEGLLKKIKEKPTYKFLVNTGLYIMNETTLDLIPSDTFFDINDLILELKKKSKKVGVYPIPENDWVDVGQWKEYKQAFEKI